MHRLLSAILALVLSLVVVLPAAAAHLSDADLQEIQNYTLTSDFLEKATGVANEAKARHLNATLDIANANSLDAMASQLNARSDVRALLARHDLTAHEYLTGSFALVRAGMTVMMRAHPDQSGYIDKDKVNDDNVEFYKAHKAEADKFFAGAADK